MLIIVTGENALERVFGLTRRTVKRLVPSLRGIMADETFAGLTPTMPFDPPAPSTGPDQAEKPDGTEQANDGPAGTPDGAAQSGDGPAGTTADGTLTVLGRSEWALDWNEELGETQVGTATETAPPQADPAAIDITADSPSRYRH